MAGMSQAQIDYQTKHINDDRSSEILGLSISMAIMSILAVIGRVACRRKLKMPLSYDDYMIFYGLLMYGTGITAIKLSILLFYCRLFPKESTTRRWRICVYVIAAVLIGYLTAGAPVTIFQCRPIEFAWTHRGNGKCLYDRYRRIHPLPANTSRMETPTAEDVCITSIVRFFYVGQIVPLDATWTQVDVTIWSIVEPSTGILSACLPIMSPLLRIKITRVRSLSWFGLSQGSDSPRDATAADRRMDLQMPETVPPPEKVFSISRETSTGDEEMAMASESAQPVART
ncbi:MAG: hypothetical protein Q9209_007451 [Squamulea sp. 1 TL-2023]